MANYVYTPYRNVCVGKTSDYTARKLFAGSADSAAFTSNLRSFFNDEGTVAAAATDVFQSTYTAGENPAFAAPHPALASATTGTVAAGVLDADDKTFTGATVLTGATSVEDYIIYKYDVTAATAAGSAVCVNFNSATGLPLTPNGADVTVVFNASGIWKF